MAEVTIPYKPRELQATLHETLKRWNLFVCHRRFGKTVFAVNQLIKDALTCPRSNPRFAYLAPLYKQAKAVAWDYLKHYSRPIPGVKINESELRIDYPNGGRVQLYGCDSPDSLRGVYLDGVVLDEYAQMPVSLFSEVIRPALSDREGYAIFIGTPKGKNAFYDLYQQVKDREDWLTLIFKASETDILPEKELADAKTIMGDDEYAQEYECSWQASIKGAYYAEVLAEAKKDGRITRVAYDSSLPVTTVWDIGVGDSTAIIFYQSISNEVRIIDYLESSGEGLPYYIAKLKNKPYIYKQHIAPHDIEVREFSSGKSRRDTAAALGVKFDIATNIPIDDGIDNVRRILSRCWIDESKCAMLIESLFNYKKEWDDKRKEFKDKPYHDWSSHAADAMRYLAVSHKDQIIKRRPQPQPAVGWMAA